MQISRVSPTNLYLGLFLSDPEEDASGTEASGGGYARTQVAWNFLAGRVDAVGNSGLVTFPTATADWGVVTHWAVFDSVTGGNMLYFGSANLARDTSVGVVNIVPVNNLRIDASGADA